MHDIIGAVRSRSHQIRGREGVIDDQPCSVAVRQLGQGWEVRDPEQWVRNRLTEHRAHASLGESGLHLVEVEDVDELGLDAEWTEHEPKQGDRLSVEIARSDDPIARFDTGEQCHVECSHTGTECQGGFLLFECGDRGLQCLRGRITVAAVHEEPLGPAEGRIHLVEILVEERRRWIDRSDRRNDVARRWPFTGMDSTACESQMEPTQIAHAACSPSLQRPTIGWS
ncbi:hypothetical protein HRbin27_01497 [bacterium HR27]|nr:hypothetical protein HRbin27_01497 [bacterium HR27]